MKFTVFSLAAILAAIGQAVDLQSLHNEIGDIFIQADSELSSEIQGEAELDADADVNSEVYLDNEADATMSKDRTHIQVSTPVFT